MNGQYNMRITRIGILITALIATSAGCQSSGTPQTGGSLDVRSAIRSVASSDSADQVRTFYERREHRPAWVEANEAPKRLRESIRLLCGAGEHGLNPADYVSTELKQKIERAYGVDHESDSVRARRLAELDADVSRRLMELAEDLVTGRVNPKNFGGTWKTPVHQINPVDAVGEAAAKSDPRVLERKIIASHDQYAELRKALERYRSIRLDGGFEKLQPGPALAMGDSSARVRSVRRRLVQGGDLDSSALADTSLRFDERIASGVRSFQERHALKVDGIVGDSVRGAMNVSLEKRIRTLEFNLERWRWVPGHLGGRYLYVNIPAFKLRAFEQGEEVLQSAVVVGEQYDARSTPVFSDTMEYVVFNPYWNLPQSIANEEVLPNAREDTSYLARNDFELLTGWDRNADVVPATPRNLELVASGDYRVRQKPGPQNALGRIKFMFPNEFDIYLHDTPADHLFDRRDRAYSHGCIRVEREIDLAEYAFASDAWTEARIERMIESRDRETIYLDEGLSVYILYWTSFVDDDGRVHFREDIYGHDEALRSAIAGQADESAPISCESLTSAFDSISS